jgi:hypothetical protein
LIVPADKRLREIRLKIERAKQHVCDLEESIRAFRAGDPYGLMAEHNAKTGEIIYKVQIRRQIPDDMPLIIGDAVHNLRSALDYLACQLAEAAGGVIDKQAFPIFETAAEYKPKQSQIKGIAPAAISRIEAVQPYHSGYEALWALQELDNRDKHRLLIVAGIGLSVPRIIVPQGSAGGVDNITIIVQPGMVPGESFPILEDGTELFRVRVSAASQMKVKFEIPFDVAFREPEVVKRQAVLPCLTQLSQLVESIINAFVPCL